MCWCIHCAGRKLAGAKHHLALGLPVPAIQVAVPGVGAVPPILSHSGAGIGPLDVLGVGAPGRLAWALPQEEAVGLPAVEGDGDVGGVRPGSGRQQKHPVLFDVDAKGQVVSIPLSAALSMIHSGHGASADRIQRIIAANRHQHDQACPSQPILCGTTLAAVFTRRGVTRIWYGWVERFGYSTAGRQFSIKDSTFPFDYADRKADQKVLMSWYGVAPEYTWPPGASSGNPPLVVGPGDRDLVSGVL